MNDYAEVLEQCLEASRRGNDVQAIIAAHPAYADRLREDLRSTAGLRELSTALPTTDVQRHNELLARLDTQVRAARIARAAAAAGTVSRPWYRRPLFAGFAAAAVLLLAVVALGPLSGALNLTGEADAATLEGIVVDYEGGVLRLQTEKGVEKVQVDAGATIENEPGAAPGTDGFTAGELVRVQAQKLARGVLRAKAITRRHGEALAVWCSRHPVECAQAEQQQSRLAGTCNPEVPACRLLRARLEDLTAQRTLGERFVTLRDRCQAREAMSCRELLRVCQQHQLLCQSLPQRLRNTPATGE